MRFDRKFLIVVACSLIWAAIVSMFFYRVASSSTAAPANGEKDLVVASQILPLGATIHPSHVKVVRVPQRLFPAGGFSKIEEVVDRPVVSPILEGEALVEGRLAARGSGLGMAPMIPPGMRALSVRVNDVAGVAGFVLPGMRVDVLVTGRPPGRDDSVTTTVLQNILVLSAGQTLQADAKAQTINAPVVSLLVDPAQAEILTLANTEGHIQLVLRNSTDQQAIRPPGRALRDLFAAAGHSEPLPRPMPDRPVERARASREPSRPQPPPAVEKPAPVLPEASEKEEVTVIRGNVKTIETAVPKAAPGGSR